MNTRFGIIGYGHIGRRHAKIIQQHAECDLIAITDIRALEKQSGIHYYIAAEEMLAAEELDVVCVCTPNGLHASHALTALRRSCHVICEKPLAITESDGLAMFEMAEQKNVQLACVLQNRYSPQIQWLKEMLEHTKLGDIYQIQINCFWNRDNRYYLTEEGTPHPWRGTLELDGGPLYTQFSHFIDILIWLVGDVRVTATRFENFGHNQTITFEDAGYFAFEWGPKSFGSFHYSTAVWDTNQESSITLIGSRGSVRIGGQYMNQVEYCHVDSYTMPELAPTPEVNDYGGYRGSANNHYFVIQNMVEVIQHGAPADFDPMDAVRGIKLIEEIYRHRS